MKKIKLLTGLVSIATAALPGGILASCSCKGGDTPTPGPTPTKKFTIELKDGSDPDVSVASNTLKLRTESTITLNLPSEKGIGSIEVSIDDKISTGSTFYGNVITIPGEDVVGYKIALKVTTQPFFEGVDYQTPRATECLIQATEAGKQKTGEFHVPETIEVNGVSKTVTGIANDAFKFAALETITFENENNLTTIGDSAFANSGIKTFTVPTNVTTLGNTAFNGCSSLITFNINDKISIIPNNCFGHCSLETFAVPKNITKIGEQAFQFSSLKSITFAADSTLSRIEQNAFSYCQLNTNVVLPASLTYIGGFVFTNNNSLGTVTFSDTNNWYENKNDGKVDVTDPTTNRTNLLDTKFSPSKSPAENWGFAGLTKK